VGNFSFLILIRVLGNSFLFKLSLSLREGNRQKQKIKIERERGRDLDENGFTTLSITTFSITIKMPHSA
jgi:hypothetical protein